MKVFWMKQALLGVILMILVLMLQFYLNKARKKLEICLLVAREKNICPSRSVPTKMIDLVPKKQFRKY